MTTEDLKTAFEDLWNLKFPDPVETDDLADWIMELAEFDGYVAGIASTILKHGSTDTDTTNVGSKFEEFGERLSKIRITADGDRSTYEECKNYLEVLRAVVNEIGK